MRVWLLISGIVFVLDQITKFLCFTYLELHKVVKAIPFFNLQLVYNEGAAFGFLSDQPGWQRIFFILISIIISFVICYWLYQTQKNNSKNKKLECLSLALILGGALGNLFDRIWHGFVIDFIDFYVGDWHWYNFNIADVAICVGAGFYVFSSFNFREVK